MHDASSSSSNFGDYDNSNSSGGLEINSDIYSSPGGGGGLRGMGLGESKIQYVRHMVFQYLTCKDSIVKPHIESALVALFRFNELERLAILLLWFLQMTQQRAFPLPSPIPLDCCKYQN